jgi:hypothetical protein
MSGRDWGICCYDRRLACGTRLVDTTLLGRVSGMAGPFVFDVMPAMAFLFLSLPSCAWDLMRYQKRRLVGGVFYGVFWRKYLSRLNHLRASHLFSSRLSTRK